MIDVRSAGFVKGGFIDSWMKYAEPFEFPESYGVFALLACASAAINGRILVNPGSEPAVMTNTYTLLVGPSGARKGTAMKHAVWLLADALPKDVDVLPRSFTVEICKLRLAAKSQEKGKGPGMILADEFSDLVGAKYKEGITRFFTDIWDCPPVYPFDTVAHDYNEIIAPYITGLWCSSPDWIYTLDPKLFSGGFWRRVLGVVEHGPKGRNPKPARNMALFAALSRRFYEVLRPAAFDDGTWMKLTPEAQEVKREWYEEVVPQYHNRGEVEGHFASCMEAHALKLAAGVHVLEGGDPKALDAPALRVAHRLLEAIVEPLFQWYAGMAPTPFARLKAAVLRVLQGAGGEMSVWALAKAVKAATGVKEAEYVGALEELARDRMVEVEGGKVRCRT